MKIVQCCDGGILPRLAVDLGVILSASRLGNPLRDSDIQPARRHSFWGLWSLSLRGFSATTLASSFSHSGSGNPPYTFLKKISLQPLHSWSFYAICATSCIST